MSELISGQKTAAAIAYITPPPPPPHHLHHLTTSITSSPLSFHLHSAWECSAQFPSFFTGHERKLPISDSLVSDEASGCSRKQMGPGQCAERQSRSLKLGWVWSPGAPTETHSFQRSAGLLRGWREDLWGCLRARSPNDSREEGESDPCCFPAAAGAWRLCLLSFLLRGCTSV